MAGFSPETFLMDADARLRQASHFHAQRLLMRPERISGVLKF
jgi:hypothetical protein